MTRLTREDLERIDAMLRDPARMKRLAEAYHRVVMEEIYGHD
ncbi:MAG: hypothetical protein ACYDCK_03770 [Thermoplasmatota archaeon]